MAAIPTLKVLGKEIQGREEKQSFLDVDGCLHHGGGFINDDG